jgi:hypothetical protein
MTRQTSVALTAFLLAACASAPPKVDEAAATAATKQLISSSRPWASQAIYTPQHKNGEWLVVVSCNKCQNPDGSPVAAEYLVRVDRRGKATFLVGLGQ